MEPKKVIQALEDPSWIEAMQEELLQFQLQKVWTLVNLPNGKRAIGTKWVFRNKKDERGIVVRNKARLVAQDPQFPDKVYKVEKALYGLHQAPRAWYETLSTYLIENGFRRGTIDKTLFIKKDKGDILLVQVYVDDIIFGSTKKSLCDEFEALGPGHNGFTVCSLYRFQVTPKMSHLHVVKSDYASASLDRKSQQEVVNFLVKRLISWQCRADIVVNSTIERRKKQSRRCQKKRYLLSPHPSDSTADVPNNESMPTHSNDPLLSGEDRLKLTDLMDMCTKLFERVLDLEHTKTDQAQKITKLKLRVKKKDEIQSGMMLLWYEFLLNDMIEKDQDVIPKEVSTVAPSTTVVPPPVITEIALDEEMARNLEAQIQAELIEKERFARKKEEEANIALIESWDNTQAMMEADFKLARRLQAEEQGEITIEERSRLFVELMNKRKKHFAKLRAEEKRRKPPTNQLKSKSYDEIQKFFDNEIKRVNTCIPMDSEVVKSKEGIEESSKRIEDEFESDKLKKAESSEKKTKGGKKDNPYEHEEAEEDNEAEMKKHMEVVQDDEEIAIDVIPLATKPSIIVEYKIVKEWQKGFYHLIRADGSLNRYSSMIRMLQNISREDLETLWKLVKTKHGNTKLEDDYEKEF
ncbi:putative ribonuclease H-like domain-containing protein [Tanacetum coccineum]|uniref:Ribonuclease H-like domain-containing protein n=1 Tax=Tanacetum coccineum TaxID=301880 RepID=A0ABQ5BE06_9ASTR